VYGRHCWLRLPPLLLLLPLLHELLPVTVSCITTVDRQPATPGDKHRPSGKHIRVAMRGVLVQSPELPSQANGIVICFSRKTDGCKYCCVLTGVC
jgi:hypothetical protein